MSIDERNPMDSVNRPEPDLVVSPELVLVDPDLARLARERLSDAPHPQPSPRVRVLQAEVTAPPEQIGSLPRRRAVAARAVGAFATAIPALLLGAVAVGMVASEVQAQLLDDPIAQVAQTGRVATPPISASAAPRPPASVPQPGSRPATKQATKPARPRPTQAPSAARPARPAGAPAGRRRSRTHLAHECSTRAAREADGSTARRRQRKLDPDEERGRGANARAAAGARRPLGPRRAARQEDESPRRQRPGLLHPGGADAAVRLPARNRAPAREASGSSRSSSPRTAPRSSPGAGTRRRADEGGRGGKPRPPVKKRRRRPALRNFDGTRVVGRCTSPPLDWAAQGACYTAQTIFSCWTKWARGAHFL